VRKRLAIQELSSESTLLVDGPASVLLREGEASSLGYPLGSDAWTVLGRDQRLAIETPGHCSLDVRLGRGGNQEKIMGPTIPTGWREACQIAAQISGVVMVLGAVDSGKSTLSTLLANELFRQGRNVTLIDGDVGQAKVGPPTTISMSHVRQRSFDLQRLSPEVSLFIGDTSPSIVPDKVSRGLVRLRDLAREISELVIVNTDGWVSGDEALRHKSGLLESMRPDLVIGIDVGFDNDRLLDYPDCTVLRLARSSHARVRGREERKKARESGYKRFLSGAELVSLSLGQVKLRRFNSHFQMKLHGSENLRGLIAGLLDDEDRLLSISRVEGLENGALELWTVPKGNARTVELGSVVLSREYEEVGYDS
jgi:polynucleotide 5'-hydroxyl-kinase GRC3/NOL9